MADLLRTVAGTMFGPVQVKMAGVVHAPRTTTSLVRGGATSLTPSPKLHHKSASTTAGVRPSQIFVGRADDVREREAERTANQVMAAVPRRTTLQKIATTADPSGFPAPAGVKDVLASPGMPLDPTTRTFMEPRFGHDFSSIRVHTDARAAESAQTIYAQAYTAGNHIAFGAGQYAPNRTEGASLLAHELAHAVQAGDLNGSAVTVRRRRIPGAAELASDLSGADLAAHAAGLLRVLHSEWDELSSAKRGQILFQAESLGIKAVSTGHLFAVLEKATKKQLLDFIEIVRKVDPTVTLTDRDPKEEGPRPLTSDAANIAALVNEADKIYTAVASGTEDSDLSDVFGVANVAAAKVKFKNAQSKAHALQAANQIFTDRSGFSKETHLGGFSVGTHITLKSKFIDNPHDKESIAVMVHESSHAGNSDVVDLGYILSPAFTRMKEAEKLDNAADFEVIAWRVLNPKAEQAHDSPAEKKFNPGAITKKEAAMRKASETYRQAWSAAIDIHSAFWRREFDNPAEWNAFDLGGIVSAAAGKHFSQSLPYWSKVENMSVHERAGIAPLSAAPATKPVTEIDLAQSENVIRKMSTAMHLVPRKETEATALEAKALPVQTARIPLGVDEEAQVLVSLVRSQKLGIITGDVKRDERTIEELSKVDQAADFGEYVLTPRDPATFP